MQRRTRGRFELHPLFDDVIAAELTVRDGRFTGELTGVPPTGETRAQAMIDYAAAAYAPDAFCRWDDDDYSLPWRLETSARELEKSGRLEWRPNNYWWFRKGLPELHEVTRAGNTHVMALWRPDVLDVIGGYPDTTGDEDQRFNRELDRHGVSPMVGGDLDPMQIFYVYRWGVSQRHLSGRGGRREELDDHYQQIGELPIQRGTFEITPRRWDWPTVVKTIATGRSDCTKRPYWQL